MPRAHRLELDCGFGILKVLDHRLDEEVDLRGNHVAAGVNGPNRERLRNSIINGYRLQRSPGEIGCDMVLILSVSDAGFQARCFSMVSPKTG